MFPADFAYAHARSLDEALDLLDEAAEAGQEAKLIAGGQSLLPMMKLRLAAPEVLIDIGGLRELRTAGWTAGLGGRFNVLLGALTTYRQLGLDSFLLPTSPPSTAREGHPVDRAGQRGRIGIVPALTDALAVLADPQVRARGTIGGAVAHGDPAADLPAVLLALNATVTIASRKGRHQETVHRLAEDPGPQRASSGARPPTGRTWARARCHSTTSCRASTPPTWPRTRSSPTSASAARAPGAAPTRSSRTRPATCRWRASARCCG